MADNIQNLGEGNFRESVGKGIAVTGFWAPWCHTCHAVMPLLDNVASAVKNEARFFKINVVENPGISSQYGVMSLPNILIFRDGKVVDQIIGSTSQQTIESRLKKVLA